MDSRARCVRNAPLVALGVEGMPCVAFVASLAQAPVAVLVCEGWPTAGGSKNRKLG